MGSTRQQTLGEGAPLYVSPGEVRQIQRRLARIGLDPGPIDGRWDPQTQQALARFQQHVGLPPTGNVDLTTFNALRNARRSSGQFLGLGEQGSGTGMRQGMMGMQRGMPMHQPGMGMPGMQGMPMHQPGMGMMGMEQPGKGRQQGIQR
ncbi:MAG: peptidoglycan-binding protein [Hyphomicrobiaceae bacterium]|nr:peptidoglycan-binding protein [Hyphomicrobiaceae bacterium]